MSNASSTVVGISPWLPWPLSAWSWWTVPVRAERLALLRIGLALCLLADISYHYAPETFAYFASSKPADAKGDEKVAEGRLGDPGVFDWRFQPPRTTWSLLRGVGDLALLYLALAILIATTLWIVGTSIAWLLLVHENPPADDRTGVALGLWIVAFLFYTAGLWSEMTTPGATPDFLAWLVPLFGFTIVCLFWVLELAQRLRDRTHRLPWLTLTLAFGAVLTALLLGGILSQASPLDQTSWWIPFLRPWQDDKTLLVGAMGLWIGSAAFLLLGCCTRLAAIVCWALSMSFANANPYLDNAGDTIRLIILFYLMFCPCGASLSLDSLWRKQPGPVYVHPWPIRMLFVQMIFMYWMNGLYKLFGASWIEGSSLHYVLGDLALTRASHSMLPLPFEVTRFMTWSVLIWEATFPFAVIFRWPRRLALVMGVMFHLGIFASMELGGFVPYALCLYLPLIPWPRESPSS